MRKCKLVIICFFLLFFKEVAKADTYTYSPVFKDSFLLTNINSIKYDETEKVLYINENPAEVLDENLYYVYFENKKVSFRYDPDLKTVTASYLKPIGHYLETRVKIYTLNDKVILYINDGINSKEITGERSADKISFGSVSFYIGNSLNTFSVYLDKNKNEVVFKGRDDLNFSVKRNGDNLVEILLTGISKENKIYAVNDPSTYTNALAGDIETGRIESYIKDSIELKNTFFNVSITVKLKKMMEKWTDIGNNSFKKEDITVICTNSDKECEVYPRKAYLINEYSYKDIEEDKNNLIPGSKNTPENLRIYDGEYLYASTMPIIENAEITKQERDVIKTYNDWSSYEKVECVDEGDKKCRYKTFYNKYIYKLISSTPIYSDWILQSEKLLNPITATETEFTDGPYINCLKYEEENITHYKSECLARDDTKHRYAIRCREDSDYTKLCLAEGVVTKNNTLKLEPVDEKDREFCGVCTVDRVFGIKSREDGTRYTQFTLNGESKTVDVPLGNCINIKEETYTETIKGQCLERGLRYDLYKREYLGNKNVYSDTPVIIEDLDECIEANNTSQDRIKCEEIIKSSYSYPDISYDLWEDVEEFSLLEQREKRYKYRTFKTYGAKITDKKIKSDEYDEKQINSFIKDIAESQARLSLAETIKEYYLLKKSEDTEAFKNKVSINREAVKQEKIFAPIIYVLEKEISKPETISFENYEGSKVLGERFEGTYIPIEETVYIEEDEETSKNIVFFDSSDTSKIASYQNWSDKEELLKEIENSSDPEYVIAISKKDLIEMRKYRNSYFDSSNCAYIRKFADLVIKPDSFKDLIIKNTGCEINP